MYKTNDTLFDELLRSKVNLVSDITKNKYLKLIKDRFIPAWEEIYTNEPLNIHKMLLDGPQPFIAFMKSMFDENLANRIRIAVLAFFIHTSLREESELYSVWKHDLNEVYQFTGMSHCQQNMPSAQDKKALTIDENFDTDKKFIDQEFIRGIYSNLIDGSDDKLYFAFMGAAGQPPLRSTDCYRIHLTNSESDIPNYIDLSKNPKYELILREYKTSKLYKKKVIPLVKEICNQIDITLKLNPREFLFVHPKTKEPFTNRSNFGKYANLLLRKHLGNNFGGGRLLRHTYVSDPELDFKNMTNKQRASVAHIMGNSEPTIQFNYLYKDTSEWNDSEPDEISQIDNLTENQNIDLDKVKEAKIRVKHIQECMNKLNKSMFLNLFIFLQNPLCIYPLNVKGEKIPLQSLWKCHVGSDSQKHQNNLVKEESLYKIYVFDDKYGRKEYIIILNDTNKDLFDSLLSNVQSRTLNDYKNTQYYYKTFLDVLRSKEIFPELPDNYSLRDLQNDVVLSNEIHFSDEELNNHKKSKSKKNKKKKKKKTKTKR